MYRGIWPQRPKPDDWMSWCQGLRSIPIARLERLRENKALFSARWEKKKRGKEKERWLLLLLLLVLLRDPRGEDLGGVRSPLLQDDGPWQPL